MCILIFNLVLDTEISNLGNVDHDQHLLGNLPTILYTTLRMSDHSEAISYFELSVPLDGTVLYWEGGRMTPLIWTEAPTWYRISLSILSWQQARLFLIRGVGAGWFEISVSYQLDIWRASVCRKQIRMTFRSSQWRTHLIWDFTFEKSFQKISRRWSLKCVRHCELGNVTISDC